MDIGNGGELVKLPVDDLVLDQTNPRIARLLEYYGNDVPPEQMQLALAADTEQSNGQTTYHSLRVSIQTNRGIIHPIIVNRCGLGDVVIEGNTRTLIYREFNEREPNANWSEILCLLYRDLPPEQIDAIRLQAHLVGPREWDPYSKAKYLNHLRNSQHLTWEQVVDFCGGQRSQARNYVAAYNDMERYYRPTVESDGNFDVTRFSAFVELQRPPVVKALLDNKFDKGDFAVWVHRRLIHPLYTVRSLPAILNDSKAREVFLREGAQAARRELDAPSSEDVIKDASLHQLAVEVSRRVLSMSYSELNSLRQDVGSVEATALADARDNLIQLCTDIAGE